MTVTCPHCHSEYDPPQLALDWTHNTMIIDGVPHRLRGQLMEIFSVLYAAYPDVVTHERLAARIYGGGEGPVDERGTVTVQCSFLRTALKGTGWTIANTWGVGYRLTEVVA